MALSLSRPLQRSSLEMWKDLVRWQRTLMRWPKKWSAWLTRTRPSGQVSRVGRGLCFAGSCCSMYICNHPEGVLAPSLPPPVLSLMFPTAAQIPVGCQVNLSAALSAHQTASVKLKGFFLRENVSLPSEGACIHRHAGILPTRSQPWASRETHQCRWGSGKALHVAQRVGVVALH